MTARMVSAYVLYYIGIFGCAAYVLIFHAAKHRIAAYVFDQDLKVHNKIIPCYTSWLMDVLGFGSLALIPTGIAIGRQEYAMIIFVAIVYALFGMLMVNDSCTYLDLVDDYISVKVFRKKDLYLRSDIRTIEWKNGRGITGKQLVIVFSDGKSYFFNIDHYRGVQNTYNELTS